MSAELVSAWPADGADGDLIAAVRGLLDAHPGGVLPIVAAGHPVLRTVAARYTGQLGALLPELLAAMVTTMRAAPGVGVAAPQIGVGLAIAVLEDPGLPAGWEGAADARERAVLPLRTIINPQYDTVDGQRRSFFEGCLSVAGYQAVVTRPRSVRLRAVNGSGRTVDEVLTGWPARIVQHETDHLGGTLYLDRAEPRSLCAVETYAGLWADEAVPERAAAMLGFELSAPDAEDGAGTVDGAGTEDGTGTEDVARADIEAVADTGDGGVDEGDVADGRHGPPRR